MLSVVELLFSFEKAIISLSDTLSQKKNKETIQTMAPSPSKNMPAFGASPGPKSIAVTAATSTSTPMANKVDARAKAKSSSGGGGKGVQVIAALAALALAAAVARWLSGSAVVVELAKTAPPPAAAAVTSEVAFDAADPDSMPLPGLHVDGGNNAPRSGVSPWPALVRVERQRLKPRKRGAMERAVEVRAREGEQSFGIL